MTPKTKHFLQFSKKNIEWNCEKCPEFAYEIYSVLHWLSEIHCIHTCEADLPTTTALQKLFSSFFKLSERSIKVPSIHSVTMSTAPTPPNSPNAVPVPQSTPIAAVDLAPFPGANPPQTPTNDGPVPPSQTPEATSASTNGPQTPSSTPSTLTAASSTGATIGTPFDSTRKFINFEVLRSYPPWRPKKSKKSFPNV